MNANQIDAQAKSMAKSIRTEPIKANTFRFQFSLIHSSDLNAIKDALAKELSGYRGRDWATKKDTDIEITYKVTVFPQSEIEVNVYEF